MSKSNIKKKIAGGQLLPGVFVSLAISFLIFLYAPIDLYCANISEFWFDFSTLLLTAFGMFTVSVLVLLLIYVIALWVHPKVYRIALTGGLALFICTYIQGNFMIDRLPPLDGTSIWWEKYDVLRMDTLMLWGIVLTIAIIAAIFLKKEKFEKMIMFISGVMALMLLVTVCSTILTSGALTPKVHMHISVENEFQMSEEENFVIFVLDTADSREFTAMLEDHPEYREIFSDFTYYENMMGNYSCTMNAVAYILSGKWFENQEPLDEYLNDVYLNSPLWEELRNRGYRIDLYEDDIRALDDSVVDNFANVYHTTVSPSSYLELAKEELKLVGFRYAPYDLKRYCETREVYFDELQVSKPDGTTAGTFTENNMDFKVALDENGVTVDQAGKIFKFIHLEGAHAPFIYGENMDYVPGGDYRQNMEASITLAKNYIQALKESGAYDNTAIIVMADHGYNGQGDETDRDVWMRPTPMFLVKGKEEQHDTMQISEAPVSYVDLWEAYMRLMDGEKSDALFDWKEGDARERRYFRYSFSETYHLVEYIQKGHAQNLDTLEPTGREFNR